MDSLNSSEKFLLSQQFVSAARLGEWHRVRQLLSRGVSVNQQDEHGWSALHFAAEVGNIEIVRELLQANADLNVEGRNGWTPLHKASHHGHADVVIELCERGSALDSKESEGWTPLLYACLNGHTDVVTSLAEKGASLELANKNGVTPLHCASAKGHDEVVTELIKRGASTNLVLLNGATPLHSACLGGYANTLAILIDSGAAVNPVTNNGWTPLHYACRFGFLQAGQQLLTARANINQQSHSGHTPLHFAVCYSHLALVKSLLAYQPDLTIESDSKSTPLSVACFLANIPALILILHHMWQHELDLSQSLSPSCASLAEDCIQRLAAWCKQSTHQLSASGSALPISDLSELSKQLSNKMYRAGFHRRNFALQSALADVLQDIERKRRNYEHAYFVGSFSDGLGSSLSCMRGIIDSDSDLDVTTILPGTEYHLINRCTCENIQTDQMVHYENGHVICVGKASNPTRCWTGSRLRPSIDQVSAYFCCCYPHIEVIHNESRTTHLSESLRQSLRQQLTQSHCHVVTAAAPGQEGKQLRVSTTFLEKTVMRSLTSVQGQLFILLKYLIKKVIGKKVKGLKTYNAKCLLFEMLDRTPEAQWQECNMIRLTEEALNLLLKNLSNRSFANDECMKHFFLRDAAVYLKKGGNSRSEIAQQVTHTLHNLPDLLQHYMSTLKEVEGHDNEFRFHPFAIIPDMYHNVNLVKSGDLEYHDIYSAVRDVIVQLSEIDCSLHSVTAVIKKIPDCAHTARESLRAMTYLKFEEKRLAVNVLQSYINEGHAVSRGITCPSTITADAVGVDMVWQHLQQSDSAWKFCFRIAKRPTLGFVSDFITKTFPSVIRDTNTQWFLNFDALMKCLCLELIGDAVPALSWFTDVVRNEDADVQQLLMTLHYCRDVNVLVDLIHSHTAAIADQDDTVNAVEVLMLSGSNEEEKSKLRNRLMKKSISILHQIPAPVPFLCQAAREAQLREAVSKRSLEELRRQLGDKEPREDAAQALRLLAQKCDHTAAAKSLTLH